MSESNGDFWASVEEMQRNPNIRRSQRLDYDAAPHGQSGSQIHNSSTPMRMNEEQNRRIPWNEIFPSQEKDVDQRLLSLASGSEDIPFLQRQQNYRGQEEGFQNVGFRSLSEDRFQNPEMSRFSFKNIPTVNEEMLTHNRASHFDDTRPPSFMKDAPTRSSSNQAASSTRLVDELKTLLVSNVEVRKAVLELYQNSEANNSKIDQNRKMDNDLSRASSVKESASNLYERRNADSAHENVNRDESKRYERKLRSRDPSPFRRRRSRSRSRSRSPIRRRDYRKISRDRSRSSDKSSHRRLSTERDRKDLKRKNEEKISADLEAKISKIIDEKSQKLENRTENVVSGIEFGYNPQYSQPPGSLHYSALNRDMPVVPRPATLAQTIPSPHGPFPPPQINWPINYPQNRGEPRIIEGMWDYRIIPPLPPPRPRMPSFENEVWDYEPKPSNRFQASKVLVNVPLDGKSNARKAPKVNESTTELPKVMKLALEKGKDSRCVSKPEANKSQADSKKLKTEAKRSQVEPKTQAKKSVDSKTDSKKPVDSKTDSKKPVDSKTDSKKPVDSKTDSKKSVDSKSELKKSQVESKTEAKKSQIESKTETKKSQIESKSSSHKSDKNETVSKTNADSKPYMKAKSSSQSRIQLNLINKRDKKNEQLKKKPSILSENQISHHRLKNMKKKIRKKFNLASCMYCGIKHIGQIDSLSYAIVKQYSEAAFTKTVSQSGRHNNVNVNNANGKPIINTKDDDIVVTVVDKSAQKKNVEIVNISDEELEEHYAAVVENTETSATETEKLEDISSNEENEEEVSDFDFHVGSEDEFILLEEFKETEIEEISSEEENCAEESENLDVDIDEGSTGLNNEDFDINEVDKVSASIINDVLAETIPIDKELTENAPLDLIDTVDKEDICERRDKNITSEIDEVDIEINSSVTKETEEKLQEILDQITEKEVADFRNLEDENSEKDKAKEKESNENSNECEILEEEKDVIEEDVLLEKAENVQSVKMIDNENRVTVEKNMEDRDFIPLVTLNDEKCDEEEVNAKDNLKPVLNEVIEVSGSRNKKIEIASRTNKSRGDEEVIKLNENFSEVVELEGENSENNLEDYFLSDDAMKVLGSNIVDLVNDIEDKMMAEKNNSAEKKIEVIEVEDSEEPSKSDQPIDNANEKNAEMKSLVEDASITQISSSSEGGIECEKSQESEICELQPESSSQVSKIALTVNSDLALDHFVAGSFEKAMQLLHQQVGIVNFVPYKSIIEKFIISTIRMTPEMPSYLGKTAPKLSFNMEDMVKRLQTCYQATTLGNLEKANTLFRLLLRDILLMKIDTKKSVAKARMLIKICRNYIISFVIELKKKDLSKDDLESEKRACELSAYATNCNLQPVHQILTLRIANSLYFKIGNFKTAASFAKKILEAKPHSEIAVKTKKMLAICEKTPNDAVILDYDCEKAFVICAGSLTPIYYSEEEIKCPLCQASYMPCFKGSLCGICNLAEIGKICSGLKLVNDNDSKG